jgi:hypothetical protein
MLVVIRRIDIEVGHGVILEIEFGDDSVDRALEHASRAIDASSRIDIEHFRRHERRLVRRRMNAVDRAHSNA